MQRINYYCRDDIIKIIRLCKEISTAFIQETLLIELEKYLLFDSKISDARFNFVIFEEFECPRIPLKYNCSNTTGWRNGTAQRLDRK